MGVAVPEGLYEAHLRALDQGYAHALAAHDADAVVLHVGVARPRSVYDDQHWSLRPMPHFQHWLPLVEPGALLYLRPGARPTLVRHRTRDFWEQAPVWESDHFLPHFSTLWVDDPKEVQGLFGAGVRVAWLSEAGGSPWGGPSELDNPRTMREALDALRVHKTPYERWCLREANGRAAAGHDAVRRAFEGGASTEFALHLEFLRATVQDDPETPYKNIVALGRNAATLHHVSYGKRPDEGPGGAQALLLDAGATCLGYCADITRTWVRGRGAAADVFTALVEGVDALQQALCAEARVGRPYESLHDESHARVGALLSALGVLRGGPEEAVARGVTRAFYPHGLGHSLGLQCHDVGCAKVKPRADNPFLRNTSVIAPGQSFTVEPGVYFIESLLGPVREGAHRALVDWALVDALAPLGGVRIEDDVVVREGEPVDNLTRPVLPRGGGRV